MKTLHNCVFLKCLHSLASFLLFSLLASSNYCTWLNFTIAMLIHQSLSAVYSDLLLPAIYKCSFSNSFPAFQGRVGCSCSLFLELFKNFDGYFLCASSLKKFNLCTSTNINWSICPLFFDILPKDSFQKLWKTVLTSSKNFFSFLKYSFSSNFFPSFLHFPDSNGQMKPA